MDETRARNRKRARNKDGRRTLGAVCLLICALALLMGAFGQRLVAQRQSRAGAIRVVLQPGGVARQRGNQVVRTTAAKDMAVFFQDVLETGVGGRMRARLDDGSILALGAQSRLTVVEHNAATEQTTLQLEYGKVRAQVVQKTRPDAKFEVHTNTAVAGVLGTDEVVDAFSPISTSVLCIDGLIEVRNSNPAVVGTVLLNPGEITFVNQGIVPTPPRPATPAEIRAALDGSGGAAPDVIADIGTGFVTAGNDLVLSGADSFVTGTIVSYQWTITRQANNQVVYSQIQSVPELLLDTTILVPGNYLGTLTITTSNGETATTSFGFVVLPSTISNTSPEEVIQAMQLAYETLQPNEFMKLFDPVKYSGYAALQQSVEASFRNLSQARVYVRRASGQIFEQGHVAIYQVDFEIRFSTKAEPAKTYVTREQATLRLESGSGWLITDVPQGNIGGGGLLGIPGVGNPSEGNAVPVTGNTGTGVPNITLPNILSEGGAVAPGEGTVVVFAGGSNSFDIQNTATVPVTISFDPPPGISVSGGGTTFTIDPGGTLSVVFTASPDQPAGTVTVGTSITSGNSTLPGPTIPVTVGRLSLSFPGGSPLPVLLGFDQSASVQVDSTVQTGHTVNLSASGGQVGASFSPNPVVIAQGSDSGGSTITLTPNPNAAPGADGVSVTASAEEFSVSETLLIDRIAPFTLTRTTPDSLLLIAGKNPQPGTVSFQVDFNELFTGPVVIAAPSLGGVTVTPPAVTLNSSGAATFTVSPGLEPVAPTPVAFTAQAGSYQQSETVTVSVVLPPLQCSLSASPTSLSLVPGQAASVLVTLELLGGTPRPVDVIGEVLGDAGSLFTLSGGGTLQEAAGQVSFTVTANQNAVPGTGSFRVAVPKCGTTLELNSPPPEVQVGVAIQGTFSLGGPASVNLVRGESRSVAVDVVPADGFKSPINLAYSCTAGDITASGPASLPPGQLSFNVDISASPTAVADPPPTCSVEGTSGTASALKRFDIRISSFLLSTTAPSPIEMVIGETPGLSITVTGVQGFTGDVTLTAQATNGIEVNPPSALVTGGNGEAIFTLSAGPSAQGGSATVTVTGAASGGLSAQLVHPVILNDGFLLSSNPATFFLGNSSPLVINVIRESKFTGGVELKPGTLPAGIVSVTPASVVVPPGGTAATFQVVADVDPKLSGRAVAIPFTGTAIPPVAVTGVGRAASGSVARLAALDAKGTLKAPFTLTGGGDLGTVPVGQSQGRSVTVAFAEGFAGTVDMSSDSDSDVTVSITPTVLTASGNPSFKAVVSSGGSFGFAVIATAGDYSQQVSFTLTGFEPPPPVPVISSFSPTSGPVSTVVTITGVNFTGATSVLFNGTPATFTVDSDLQITATVPAGATTGLISVSNPDGTGTSASAFTVLAAPQFSLCVTEGGSGPCLMDGDFIDVNSTIPVALQVSVLPGAGFSSPVTVTVPDGTQMAFYSGCGTPSGGVYSGGALNFTLSPPFSSPANFCMSAGVPTAPSSDFGVTFTGTPSGSLPDSVAPTFRIGVPDLTIVPSTFTIPGASTAPGSQPVDISLSPSSPANVFDLPVTVFITGPGSFLSGTGPFLDPLPSGISSDCGPSTSGKTVSPGGLVTCTVTNSNTSPFDSAGNLIVFITFGPGGGGSVPLEACGAATGVRANCRAQSQRISSGYGTQGVGGGSDGKSGLQIAPDSVQFTPLAPKPGERVSIQARVDNPTAEDANGVKVGLSLNGAPAATLTVSIPAGGSQPVEFLWEAEYYQRLSFEITLQSGDGLVAQSVPVRNLFVEPELAGTFNQGRSQLEILNGDCGGFRFLLGTQTFCGASADLEFNPVITGDGQLLVNILSLNGGIIDLGPQPITGQLTVPEAGYAARGWLEPGRLYAVEIQGKYGLLYVSRIRSDIDPRLAKLTHGQMPQGDGLDGLLSDRLDDLLDRSRITVVLEWTYLENGSRRFSYGFSGVERGNRPGVIRQPRVPATPQRQ